MLLESNGIRCESMQHIGVVCWEAMHVVDVEVMWRQAPGEIWGICHSVQDGEQAEDSILFELLQSDAAIHIEVGRLHLSLSLLHT